MSATTFDSLAAARKFREAGMEQGPAEAIAGLLHKVAVANREDLATKADLDITKDGLEAQIKASEAWLKAEMVTIANRNLVATLVALGVLFAALKLF